MSEKILWGIIYVVGIYITLMVIFQMSYSSSLKNDFCKEQGYKEYWQGDTKGCIKDINGTTILQEINCIANLNPAVFWPGEVKCIKINNSEVPK